VKESIPVVAPLVTALGLAFATTGCVEEPTPQARAADVERFQICADARESADELRVLRDTKVLRVDPITFYVGADVHSEGGQRVGGVKLLVRPPDGVSADEMRRVLQCHHANFILGRVDPALVASDPYVLPETWVDIDVTPDRGFLSVRMEASRVWENLALLRHETDLANAPRLATAP
jgi:hypothetical protein